MVTPNIASRQVYCLPLPRSDHPRRAVLPQNLTRPSKERRAQNGSVIEDPDTRELVDGLGLFKGRDVTLSPLSGGSMNSVFLAQVGNDRYVIRKPGSSSDLLGMNRTAEHRNAEIAAETGVAPKILEYVDASDVMVLEFIEGPSPTAEDLQSSAQVRRLAQSCLRLHGGRRFVNDFDMYRKIEDWFGVCQERAIGVPDGVQERMALVGEVAQTLAHNSLPGVPCHNDLAPYNFIDDAASLRMIDFEFSGNHDPCSELGMMADEAELDEDLRALLCEVYFGEAAPRLLARMSLYNLVAQVGWMLFCAIQGYSDGVESYWGPAMRSLDSAELPTLLSDAR